MLSGRAVRGVAGVRHDGTGAVTLTHWGGTDTDTDTLTFVVLSTSVEAGPKRSVGESFFRVSWLTVFDVGVRSTEDNRGSAGKHLVAHGFRKVPKGLLANGQNSTMPQ